MHVHAFLLCVTGFSCTVRLAARRANMHMCSRHARHSFPPHSKARGALYCMHIRSRHTRQNFPLHIKAHRTSHRMHICSRYVRQNFLSIAQQGSLHTTLHAHCALAMRGRTFPYVLRLTAHRAACTSALAMRDIAFPRAASSRHTTLHARCALPCVAGLSPTY